MPPKVPRIPRQKEVRPSRILGLEEEKELQDLLEESEEIDDEDMQPPSTQLEASDAPLVYFRQHGQRQKELHRFDMTKVARLIKTVVEVQMLKQNLQSQRLDGIDKTWGLEKLEHLSLVQLELKKIDWRIGNMTLLYTVDFSDNHLHENSFPPEIANCQRLRHIKINDNRLTTIPEHITKIQSLSKLDARKNRICCIKDLKKLKNLEVVNMSYNRMLHFDLGLEADEVALKNLKFINCSHNHITAIITDLSTLPKLQEVDFSSNGLRYLNASLLSSKTLIKIHLGSNYIFKIKLPSASPSSPVLQIPSGTRHGQSNVVAARKELGPSKFLDLSNNFLTQFPRAIPAHADDISLVCNWIRFIPSEELADLKKVAYTRKEVDLTFNPLSCFHGAQALASPSHHSTAQNIIVATKLLRILYDYDERLEDCLYRGMKLIFLGSSGCGKKELVPMLVGERKLKYRQRISEHSLRMRRWLTVTDYYLNVYFGATSSKQQRPSDHRIVHSSLWKFSGSIRNAFLDYAFIRHEQMIVNLVVNLAEYTPDFQYEILGLWLDMVMTYSSNPSIIIPVGMFGEELGNDKEVSAFARQIEKYLAAFLSFREKEYKQTLDEMEAIGEAKMSLIGGAKLRSLRMYKSRLPLIHENLVKICLPGAKGMEEYLNLLKAAAFHPSFFGQYVTLKPSSHLDCLRIINDMRYNMEVPMLRFRELSNKIIAISGGTEPAVLEMAGDLHESGKIFWLGKNLTVGGHNDDLVFIDVQWLVDALYCLLDRETVQQMAAQVKKTQVYEDVAIEQCEAFIESGIMSVGLLKTLWKSLMPDYVVQHNTLQTLIITLMVSFKVGYPTNVMETHADPKVTPKGKFFVNIDQYKVEWINHDGKADPKMEPAYYQIPYLVTSTIPLETESYLKSLGLLDEVGKGSKPSETLAAEFYFPIFSPRGIFAKTVCHLGQVLKSVLFVSLWRDGVWARAADGSYGFLLQEVRKQSFKNGPVPSERSALRFFVINLTHKAGGGDAKAVCNRMWAPFVNILKEAEGIFLWFPGLFYLSHSLCPHCHNRACPAEWHDGREIAKTGGIKCKSCNKEILTYYLVKAT